MSTGTADRHPVLVCTGGAHVGLRRPVGEGGLVLGRGSHCDVVLEDPGVSREHARVLFHNEAVWVQDAGSRNGCFVNGKRLVRHKQLSPGDELKVGEALFTLDLVDPFPEHDSVSSFGGPPPSPYDATDTEELAAVVEEPAGQGRFIVAGVVLLVLTGAAIVTWMVAAG